MGAPFFSPGPQNPKSIWAAMHPDAEFPIDEENPSKEADLAALSDQNLPPVPNPGAIVPPQSPVTSPAQIPAVKGDTTALPSVEMGINEQMENLRNLAKVPGQRDLSGTFNMAKALGGADLNYTAPQTAQTYGVDMAKLENAIQGERNKYASEQIGLKKALAQQAHAEQMAKLQMDRFGLTAGRFGEIQNKNSSQAGQAFESDPILKLSKTNLNSLDRSKSILENPNKPVTAKDLNLAYTDYINSVAAGGAATEGKITRELPESFATEWNTLKGKVGQFDDLRKDPTGAKLIGMLHENINTVSNDLHGAIENQAQNIHDSYKYSDNPKVQQVIRDKLATYTRKPSPVQPDAHTAGGPIPSAQAGVPVMKRPNKTDFQDPEAYKNALKAYIGH